MILENSRKLILPSWSAWDHDLGELEEADLAVLVSVTHGEDGADLVGAVVSTHASNQLLIGDLAIAIHIIAVEGVLGVLQGAVVLPELGKSRGGGREHHCHKLVVADLAVRVDIGKGEHRLNFGCNKLFAK